MPLAPGELLNQRYRIEGQVITLSHPDYELQAMYRFDGDLLRVHSERFIVVMEPVEKQAKK